MLLTHCTAVDAGRARHHQGLREPHQIRDTLLLTRAIDTESAAKSPHQTRSTALLLVTAKQQVQAHHHTLPVAQAVQPHTHAHFRAFAEARTGQSDVGHRQRRMRGRTQRREAAVEADAQEGRVHSRAVVPIHHQTRVQGSVHKVCETKAGLPERPRIEGVPQHQSLRFSRGLLVRADLGQKSHAVAATEINSLQLRHHILFKQRAVIVGTAALQVVIGQGRRGFKVH